MGFLKEKFFNRLPRPNGIFKTNRKKGVKCPICLKMQSSDSGLKNHLEVKHSDLHDLGIEMVSPTEFKISNKLVNYLSIFCFTNPHDIATIMNIVEESQYKELVDVPEEGEEGSKEEEAAI